MAQFVEPPISAHTADHRECSLPCQLAHQRADFESRDHSGQGHRLDRLEMAEGTVINGCIHLREMER